MKNADTRKFLIINMIVGIFTYFMMISLQLINQLDGIWNSEFDLAGNWERGIGRWVWPYYDKLRFGVQTDPMCNVLAILIFVLGNMVVLKVFDIEYTDFRAYLISFLYLVNTSIGIWLSFRYMSITFAMAYLMSVLTVLVCKKGLVMPEVVVNKLKINQGENADKKVRICNDVVTVVVAGLCLMISLGSYQAFFDCTCMVMLSVFILMLYRNEEAKELTRFFIKSICGIGVGAIFYFAGMKITDVIYHMDKRSNYNSASSLSIGNTIAKIPDNIGRTIYYFRTYFTDILFRWNRLQEHKAFVLLLLGVIFVMLIIGLVKTFMKNKIYGLIYLVCALLLPIATNAVLFIATESFVSEQMTSGLSFFVPMGICIAFGIEDKDFKNKWIKWGLIALSCLTIYGNYISTQIDQEACREGRTGTVTIANEIKETLIDMGYADRGGSVAFVGMPCNNERFMYTEIYPMANKLMQFGNWGPASSAHGQTWVSIYREYVGYYIQPCQDGEYEAIVARDDVAAMPMFPRAGSIKEIDGIIVVKISNNY